MESGEDEQKFSRRTFGYFLIAGIVSLLLLRLIRFKVAPVILGFFDLPPVHRGAVEDQLRRLRAVDLTLHNNTHLFFSLDRAGARFLCPRMVRQSVVQYWARTLFKDRSIGWPYVGYPQVDNTSICNRLIPRPV